MGHHVYAAERLSIQARLPVMLAQTDPDRHRASHQCRSCCRLKSLSASLIPSTLLSFATPVLSQPIHMQPSPPANDSQEYYLNMYVRDLDALLARIARNPPRNYLWNRAPFAISRRRPLLSLFQAHWFAENTRGDGESRTAYRARMRASYDRTVADTTPGEKAVIEAALRLWVQAYNELLASM